MQLIFKYAEMAYFSESELAQWLERLSIDLVSIGSNITSYFFFFFFKYILQHNQLTYREKGNGNLLQNQCLKPHSL